MLAETLGMTVAEVREMSNAEWHQWNVYLARKGQKQELERMKAEAQRGRR